MSFDTEDYVHKLVSLAGGGWHETWLCISTALLSAIFLIILFSSLTEKWASIPDSVFLFLCVLLLFVFRLPSLAYGESNPDESEWLATAITMQHGLYEYFRDFYVFDFSRSMTIFPLWIVSLLGISINYGLAKLVGMIYWIIFLVNYYYFVKDCFGKRTALLASSILVAFLATFSMPDYVAYNSETAAVSLICVSLFFFNRSQRVSDRVSTILSFASGFFLMLAFFAKEQSLYIVACLSVIFCLNYFFQMKKQGVLYFSGGAICCCLLFAAPFFIFDKTLFFVDWAKQSLDYASLGLNFNHLKWYDRLDFRYLEESVYFYRFPAYFLISLLIIGNTKLSDWFKIRKNICAGLLIVGLYAASFYTIISPSDFFPHYVLYLILPTACVIALCIHLSEWINYQKAVSICATIFFLLIAKHGLDELDFRFNPPQKNFGKSLLAQEILKYSKPGESMIVWGWDCKLYVDTNLVRGSRYWANTFLSPIYPPDFRMNNAANYEQDFRDHKPDIVVEILEGGPVRYMRPQLVDYPAIHKILDEKYTLVYSAPANRIYKRSTFE
jgi:hypothetical protein